MAGAVKFPGLVKSPRLLVGSVGACERRKYCRLVLWIVFLNHLFL